MEMSEGPLRVGHRRTGHGDGLEIKAGQERGEDGGQCTHQCGDSGKETNLESPKVILVFQILC